MKEIMIKDLAPGEATLFAAVKSKDKKEKKTGDPYLTLILADKTGEIDTKVWDDVANLEPLFQVGDVVKVLGPVGEYRGKPQLTVKKLRLASPEEVDPGDYLPISDRDPKETFAELLDLVHGIKDPHLCRACTRVLLDNQEAVLRSPAAMKVHHAHVGGLLDHMLSLSKLSLLIQSHYPMLDPDLMITACVFHDIGKIKELTVELSFDYSTPGKLLGHVALGAEMFHDLVRDQVDFPPDLKLRVEHIIISHHGKLEHGALKVPSTPEAIAFSHLDGLDANMELVRKSLLAVEPGKFSEWSKYLETQLYRGI
jgi:3'-5' exoribonuclease